jgi:hypothetical protein
MWNKHEKQDCRTFVHERSCGLRLRWRQLNSLTLIHLKGCLCEVRDPFKALDVQGRHTPLGVLQLVGVNPASFDRFALFCKGQGRSARANNGTGGPKATPWLGGPG